MIDLERLNDHSRQFARRLLRRYPDWIRHARYDPYEEFEKEALLLEIPRPADGSGHGLFISTSEWEINIGFGEAFHTRFGPDGEPESRDFYDQALDFLEGFLAEDLVVATASEDREWLGAWIIDRRRESLDDIKPAQGEHIKVRSWRGNHDLDLQAESAEG